MVLFSPIYPSTVPRQTWTGRTYLVMRLRLLFLSGAGGRWGGRFASRGRGGAVGDPTPDAHLGNELGLAEGAHGTPQHAGPVEQRHLAVGLVGCGV